MKPAILMAMVSTLFFYLIDHSILSFGKFINQFTPCVQDSKTSFPCYGLYDVVGLAVCAMIFLLSGTIIIIKIVQLFVSKNT